MPQAVQGDEEGDGGIVITLDQARAMFRQIDTDKSGTIELSEFASWSDNEA